LPAPSVASVLKHFYVSEKSARGQAHNHYTFVVTPKATKTDVKTRRSARLQSKCRTRTDGPLALKTRIIGRWKGKKAGIKKAIVTIKEGQTIAQAQP